MNDFAKGSHPPSHRHISHRLSLKLRKLVCSHISVFASGLPEQKFVPLPRIELSPVWKKDTLYSFFETFRITNPRGNFECVPAWIASQQAEYYHVCGETLYRALHSWFSNESSGEHLWAHCVRPDVGVIFSQWGKESPPASECAEDFFVLSKRRLVHGYPLDTRWKDTPSFCNHSCSPTFQE